MPDHGGGDVDTNSADVEGDNAENSERDERKHDRALGYRPARCEEPDLPGRKPSRACSQRAGGHEPFLRRDGQRDHGKEERAFERDDRRRCSTRHVSRDGLPPGPACTRARSCPERDGHPPQDRSRRVKRSLPLGTMLDNQPFRVASQAYRAGMDSSGSVRQVPHVRRRRRKRRRRVFLVATVILVALLSPVAYSYTTTMLQPSSLPLWPRSVEWLGSTTATGSSTTSSTTTTAGKHPRRRPAARQAAERRAARDPDLRRRPLGTVSRSGRRGSSLSSRIRWPVKASGRARGRSCAGARRCS